MPLPYHETIKQILLSLDVAILEAKAELPEHLHWEHIRIFGLRQFVDAWREVLEQYRPTDLIALEVYPGLQAPLRYLNPWSTCGVVLAWTRYLR